MAQTKDGAIIVAAKKAGLTIENYIELSIDGKRCTKCKDWHPKSDYGIDNSRYDGLKSKCNDCVRVKVKKSIKGRVSTFKGKTHTDEAKLIMSVANKGHKRRLGIPHTLESRAAMSKSKRGNCPSGPDSHSYKDGRCSERKELRKSKEYKNWRYDVFMRDKFTCQACGDDKGGNLEAHHIKSFADYPELRLVVDNGITLCKACHKIEHAAK